MQIYCKKEEGQPLGADQGRPRRLVRLGLRPTCRRHIGGGGGRHRYRGHMADGPEVWHLPECLLPEHGAVLLVLQRDGS